MLAKHMKIPFLVLIIMLTSVTSLGQNPGVSQTNLNGSSASTSDPTTNSVPSITELINLMEKATTTDTGDDYIN